MLQHLNTYSGTVKLTADNQDNELFIDVYEKNYLAGLTFVEDSVARFDAIQQGNRLIVSGEYTQANFSSTGELILGGVDDRLLGETVSITVEPKLSGSVGFRTSNNVQKHGLRSSYDPDKDLSTLGNTIDMDSIGCFAKTPEAYDGKSFSITLKWNSLTAVYYVEFTKNYSENIKPL